MIAKLKIGARQDEIILTINEVIEALRKLDSHTHNQYGGGATTTPRYNSGSVKL